jgi:Raf kinase inhibitor-like YbhB/YbcL family protein
MTWVHWVLYNIPAKRFALPKGVTPEHLPPGTLAGINDFFTTDYQGPCPPTGCHRYFFKIYALDTKLPDLNHPTKAQLESAMQGHILGQAQLVGRYSSDGSCE